MSFIYAFLILLAVITIHEFGHFIAARICDVKVYEFAIGVGPKLYKRQGDKTLFSIRALPLGGFCRFDQSDEEQSDDVEYRYSIDEVDFERASNFKKIIILSSGVLMNLITAVILLILMFQINGYPSTVVENVIENSVAVSSGIKPGDEIIKINDDRVRTANELLSNSYYKSGEFDLTIISDGKEIVKHIKTHDGKIGIYFGVKKDFIMSIKLSFVTVKSFIKEIIKAIKNIFSNDVKNLMGVVGFVATVGNISGITLNMIMMIVVNISISLAVFNLIPIVPLDGGHILITLIESVIGKELSDKVKNIITIIGISFVLYVFIRSLINDFSRF